jgi:hypothetical protein
VRQVFKRLSETLIPIWIASPLGFLGVIFIIFYPLGRDWATYLLALVVAVVEAVWMRTRYKMVVLERSERGWFIWLRKVKKRADEERPCSSNVILPRD